MSVSRQTAIPRAGVVAAAFLPLAIPLLQAAEPADDFERVVTLLSKIGFSRGPSFSPDGGDVAFLSNASGLPQVWSVPVASGWPAKVTGLEDPVTEVRWSPAGDWLSFSLAPGGGMNQQLYLIRPKGGRARRITWGGSENNRLGPWDRDGVWLAFSSNRRERSAVDAYTYEPAPARIRSRTRSAGVDIITDFSADRSFAIVDRLAGRGDNNLYLLDLARGRETLLTPHDPPATFEGGLFSPDARTVYLISNKGHDRAAFGRIVMDEETQPGNIEVLAARDDAELEEIAIAEDGGAAALLWNVDGKSELALFDLRSETIEKGPDLPAEVASDLTFSRDGERIALTLTGSTAPYDVWVWERASGRLRQLTNSPHAGIDLRSLVRPRLLRFRSHDGVMLTGWFYEAEGVGQPAPVVLSFHGGPESQERPVFRADYQALLRQGISVFAPNVRGSAGFGKAFINMDNGPLRLNAIRDIRACVEYLVRSGLADSRRIGIMGGSYGGYMAMAGAAHYPELFAAAANLYGVVNFETFFQHTEPWMAAISKTEYGDPETQADMLRALSPIHRLGDVRAPTLVLHGANDTNVPVTEAEQVVDHLRKRNVPVEFLLFPDEGHGFRKTANRTKATIALVRWFTRYLKR